MSSFAEELQELLPPVDPFFPFDHASPVNSVDIFTEFQTHNVAVETDACSALFLEGTGIDFRDSSLPHCQQFENLTLYGSNWSYPMEARPSYDCWESVKREKSEFGHGYDDEAFISHSYDGCDDFNKYMMQRNGFVDETREINNVHTFSDETREINNVHTFSDGWMASPQNSFFSGQIRRACSTGDLQFLWSTRARGSSPRAFSSLLAGETSLNVGEQNAKAFRCSIEERKEKILKYRAKRAQRNFNKTIKYACRKTLADTRPRIRGRFARNDEIVDTPKAAILPDDEEDGFWINKRFMGHEMKSERRRVTSYDQAHGQLRYYYNY